MAADLAWRIYYSDGSTFSSEDGDPADAPGWGVIAIPQIDPEVGRSVMCKWDHYCWHGDSWWGHDLVGMLDCLALPGASIIKHGRTLSRGAYQAIRARAQEDPDFPAKAANRPLERPNSMQGT